MVYDLLAWLVILTPFAASAWIAFRGRRLDEGSIGAIACGAVAISFGLTVALFLDALLHHGAAQTVGGPVWLNAGDAAIRLALLIDPLSLTMALVVSGVGFLIHCFARGYMHGDPHFPRFFALLNLFVGCMLTLVLANNLVFMFVGWEGVGFCSYMLIGYYTHKPSANAAGKKAFIVNRIGDLGFLLGTFVLFRALGTVDFTTLITKAPHNLDPHAAALAALLLFVGACGKSAQFPLYVWLPDAMEGPTPVSALIHAATMVTAGVYLVVRLGVIYALAPWVMLLVAFIGLLTAVLAALLALVQNDIKRVLAYSTISQLGYMFLAAGMGAPTAAIFHLVTHAFFKALLFLGSGSVIHGMEHALHHCGRHEDPQDMRHMGGLAKRMPITHWTMLIGAMAIAGVPGLAGFFSKDEILAQTGRSNLPFLLCGLGVAALTAFYMFRMMFKTFYQEPKLSPEVNEHVEESNATMTQPLMALAALSVVGGALNLPGESFVSQKLHHWLSPVTEPAIELLREPPRGAHELLGMIVSSLVALLGIGLAWKMYGLARGKGAKLARQYPEVYRVLAGKYFLDEWYRRKLIEPGNALAQKLSTTVDAGWIDGVVNGLGAGVLKSGDEVRRQQPGLVRSYALWFAAGAVAVVGSIALQSFGPLPGVFLTVAVVVLVVTVACVSRPRDEA